MDMDRKFMDAVEYVESHRNDEGGLSSAVADASKLYGIDYSALLNYFRE